jgi:hypothetical protein
MASIWDWSRTAASNGAADSGLTFAEGQMPGTVNDSARQVMGRVAELLADLGATQTTAGSANAHTLTARSGFAALATGLIVAFKAGYTNTGATTLNVNSIGAKAIRKYTTAEAALAANDIVAGGLYLVTYDAAANSAAGAWMLMTPPAIARTQTDFICGGIETVADGDYRILTNSPIAMTITETTTRSASGTATFTFKINTTALGGTANSVSTGEQTQAQASNNTVAVGDDIVITASSNSSCSKAAFTITYTKALA